MKPLARHRGALRRAGPGRTPERVLIVDTEADSEPLPLDPKSHLLRLRLWCATYLRLEGSSVIERSEHLGRDHGSWWDLARGLTHHRDRLWVYSHNALFDATMLGLWPRLENHSMLLTSVVLEDPPTIIRLSLGGRRITWVDTLNYWPMTLAEIGSSVGLPKLEMPRSSAEEAELITYCKRDVAILEKALLELIALVRCNDLGGLALTTGAQAWLGFRRRHMRHRIIVHSCEKSLELERACYMGGRAEMFHVGRCPTPVFILDANSHYLHVMHENQFPVRLLFHASEPKIKDVERWAEHMECAARVLIESDVATYPVRVNGQLLFSTGCFHTNLCGRELYQAIARGHVLRVLEAARYECRPIFTDWVEWAFARRRHYAGEQNFAQEWLIKRIGNSLYGKFGQLNRRWHDVDDIPSPVAWGHWFFRMGDESVLRTMRAIGWHPQEQLPKGEWRYSCPAIAAWVTSYGRCRLADLIELADKDNVFYVSTDSLMVSPAGYDRLRRAGEVHPTRLGALKVLSGPEEGFVFGIGDYRVGNRRTLGGVRLGSIDIGAGTWEIESWPRAQSVLSDPAVDTITVSTKRVTRTGAYFKGRCWGNGPVIPWLVLESEHGYTLHEPTTGRQVKGPFTRDGCHPPAAPESR